MHLIERPKLIGDKAFYFYSKTCSVYA